MTEMSKGLRLGTGTKQALVIDCSTASPIRYSTGNRLHQAGRGNPRLFGACEGATCIIHDRARHPPCDVTNPLLA